MPGKAKNARLRFSSRKDCIERQCEDGDGDVGFVYNVVGSLCVLISKHYVLVSRIYQFVFTKQ